MNKRLKIVCLICLLLVAATCLSSCIYLDTLRNERVEIDDMTDKSLEFRGKEYSVLDNPRNRKFADWNRFSQCSVVTKDVPLLLTRERRLYNGKYYEAADVIYWNNDYYCTAENFKTYSEKLILDPLEHYKIDYEYFDPDQGKTVRVFHVLDEKTTEVIRKYERLAKGHGGRDSKCHWLILQKCDKDGIVSANYRVEIFRGDESDLFGLFIPNTGYNGAPKILFEQEDRAVINELYNKYFKEEYLGYEYYYW